MQLTATELRKALDPSGAREALINEIFLSGPHRKMYLIGSLRNEQVPVIGNRLRKETGLEVFDDWYAAGPEADDYWKKYEQGRGRSYAEALKGRAAKNVFAFDKANLDRCDMACLVMPAGRSGHLEFGYMAGRGKPSFILFPDGEPPNDRWDVMVQFATEVFFSVESFINYLKR